jgi:hypothetical protein
MSRTVQAFAIEKKTNSSISFPTLEDALEYVSGNYRHYTVIYYDDKYNEHNYNAEMRG